LFILTKYSLPLAVALSLAGCNFTNGLLPKTATPVSVNFFTPTPVPTVSAPLVASPVVAARVNGSPILLDTVLQEVSVFRHSLTQLGEADSTPPAVTEIREQVLNKLIDQLIIEQQADLLGIKVSTEELAISAEGIRNKAESEEQFEAWLLSNQLTEEQFLNNLEAELTAQRLYDQITDNVPAQTDQAVIQYLWVTGQEQAQNVEQQIESQMNFDQIVEDQVNKNPGVLESGKIDWFPEDAGFLPAEVEAVVFQSQPGTITGPVFVSGKYYFVDVEEIEQDRPLTLDRQQALKKQLFQRWLRQKRMEAQIERLITLN
jgi:parvulin-like peptidyl-prolyl isomerase